MPYIEIKRGDVFYIEPRGVQGSEQKAGRPAVIVSNDENNTHSPTVEIAYLTTRPKTQLPTHAKVTSTKRTSTVLCEQVTTVDKERLGRYICTCDYAEMMAIDKAIAVSLGLSC